MYYLIRHFVETYFFFSCGLFLLSGIRTAWSSQPQPLSSMGQPLSIAVSLWAFFWFQRSFISLPLVARTGTRVILSRKNSCVLYYLSDALKKHKWDLEAWRLIRGRERGKLKEIRTLSYFTYTKCFLSHLNNLFWHEPRNCDALNVKNIEYYLLLDLQ